MNSLEVFGKWMLILGIFLALIGAVLWVLSRFGGLNSIPGTLRIQGSGFTCLIPILGSIVLSIVLTVVLNLIARILK